jgi:endonuclease/exonuclease/phosphatase (EEP) superfamily protein YafD
MGLLDDASRRDAGNMKNRIQEVVKDKTRMIAWLTLFFSLAGYLGGVHWLLELTCHFRIQFLVVSAWCLVVLALLRDLRGSLVGLLCVILNGAVILPWYLGRPDPSPNTQASNLRLLLSNVLTSNRRSASLIRLVQLEQPDVLVLEEVNRRWMQELAPLSALLPYSKVMPRRDNFGIAVLSRLPIVRAPELTLGSGGVPTLLADVDLDGQTISILATHPLPPGSRETFQQRNSQLAAIGALARQSSIPVILAGDLNMTMWSPYYSRLVHASGLVSARKGFGVLPTWPTQLPVLKIPLDHCLVSPDIGVVQIRTARAIGSDHLPLIVDLAIPRRQRPAAAPPGAVTEPRIVRQDRRGESR